MTWTVRGQEKPWRNDGSGGSRRRPSARSRHGDCSLLSFFPHFLSHSRLLASFLYRTLSETAGSTHPQVLRGQRQATPGSSSCGSVPSPEGRGTTDAAARPPAAALETCTPAECRPELSDPAPRFTPSSRLRRNARPPLRALSPDLPASGRNLGKQKFSGFEAVVQAALQEDDLLKDKKDLAGRGPEVGS